MSLRAEGRGARGGGRGLAEGVSGGALRGRARPGGTHFVAEVNEKHGLQEADDGHDALGWGGNGASEQGQGGQRGPPRAVPLRAPLT